MNSKLVLILLAGLFSCASNVYAEKTVLAGGCFWCMESDFEKLDGVTDVISGFSGGTLKDPIYNGNHRGVRPSKVDNSSGRESRSGKVGQPPDSKHRVGGGNSKY